MKNTLKQIFSDASPQDQRSADMIIRVLEQNNLPGFDYLEFKQSLAGLAKMNMDEGTAFQSAFVTASTLGLTKAKLVATAKHYKKVASEEKQKFDRAAQNQFTKGIAAKKDQIKKLGTAIQQRQQQIERLKAEIVQYQKKTEQLNNELCNAEEKIGAATQSFENAYQLIVNHIDDDIQKIQTFIS